MLERPVGLLAGLSLSLFACTQPEGPAPAKIAAVSALHSGALTAAPEVIGMLAPPATGRLSYTVDFPEFIETCGGPCFDYSNPPSSTCSSSATGAHRVCTVSGQPGEHSITVGGCDIFAPWGSALAPDGHTADGAVYSAYGDITSGWVSKIVYTQAPPPYTGVSYIVGVGKFAS